MRSRPLRQGSRQSQPAPTEPIDDGAGQRTHRDGEPSGERERDAGGPEIDPGYTEPAA